MVSQTPVRLAADDYFQLPDYTQHDLIQLIDGEVVIGVPPVPQHQAIVSEILFRFMTIAKVRGGRAFVAPVEVYLDEHNVFEPDVLYLAPDSRCVVGDKRLIGAPDVVVEVLSPSTAKYDRQEKYLAYERCGVREYWIVDPSHAVVEVWTLVAGHFTRQGVYAGADTFSSPTLGETVVVSVLFAG